MAPSRPREPAVNLPGIVLACIAALVGLHGLREFVLPVALDNAWLLDLALIPARWTVSQDPLRLPEVLGALEEGPSAAAWQQLARIVLAEPAAQPWTFASYALLHGSWAHVILNSVWLAAFGAPVARRVGAWRFLLLALLGALAGGIVHAWLHPLSVAPLVGASAAVSALMAAAVRFAFTPVGADLIGLHAPAHERPRQSLVELLRNRQAAVFIGVWFATNLFFALTAGTLGVTDASIAWEAHAGGFLAGLLLFPLLDPGPPDAPHGPSGPDRAERTRSRAA